MSWQVALAVGATAFQGVMQMSAANQRASQYAAQEAQYKDAAEEAQTQAAQQEVQRRQKLRTIQAANLAELQTRGLTSDSPSFQAIENSNLEQAAIDIGNIRYMGMSRRRRYLLGADDAAANASAARSSGVWGLVGAGLSIGQQVAQSWGSGFVGGTRRGSEVAG